MFSVDLLRNLQSQELAFHSSECRIIFNISSVYSLPVMITDLWASPNVRIFFLLCFRSALLPQLRCAISKCHILSFPRPCNDLVFNYVNLCILVGLFLRKCIFLQWQASLPCFQAVCVTTGLVQSPSPGLLNYYSETTSNKKIQIEICKTKRKKI